VNKTTYTLLYAAVLGTVCALLLTAAGRFTAPYREANERAEEITALLEVLKIPVPEDATADEIVSVFDENVHTEMRNGLQLTVYQPPDAPAPRAIAVPFSGMGLWGTIEGYLALENDLTTIRSSSVHRQPETPGLGGHISKPWFRKQFEGKSIIRPDGRTGIRIVPEPDAPNEVDAITGATLTGNKLQDMINETVTQLITGAADGRN
jgi:Na+-transporting NADH:ubiquinone oxidoreductase subunit C